MAHDALLCVQTGTTIDDPKRFKFEGQEHYLKTAAEMRSLFRERPDACDNTLWVAERADVQIEFGKPQLPAFPIPEGFADDSDYLRHLALEGAHQRWGEHLHPTIAERIAYISRSPTWGSPPTSSSVDLTRYASTHRVGPGAAVRRPKPSRIACASPTSTRSSTTCCSAVPQPGRIQMPDIDMDFDDRY
jgi:DNA polymerase-3 subunit alpha